MSTTQHMVSLTSPGLMLWRDTTLATVKLTSSLYCDLRYDLYKLILLSPLVRSAVGELNIPAGLNHLLDVTIVIPGVGVDTLTLLVRILRGEVATVGHKEVTDIEEVAECLGIKLDLAKAEVSASGDNVTCGSTFENPGHSIDDLDTTEEIFQIKEEVDNLYQSSVTSVSSIGIDDTDENTQLGLTMNIKAFACEECDTTCSTKKLLTRHMKIHTGDMKTPCDVCGKMFGRKDGMQIHKKKHHGVISVSSIEKNALILKVNEDLNNKQRN